MIKKYTPSLQNVAKYSFPNSTDQGYLKAITSQ
jgi:hypothetical protein